MIKTLCGVWFGYYKLFASTPRFSISEKVGKPSTTGSLFNTLDKNLSQPNSYANVVRGNPKANQIHDNEEIIHISSGDFIVEKSKRACLVKARDYLTLTNLGMLCFDEGFDELEIRYVGGLQVMLEFKHKDLVRTS